MENFNGFYFVAEENVTMENFNQKIDEAIIFLKKANNLNDDSIKQIERSIDREYHTNGRVFSGQFLSFEISKNGEITNHLNCFIDNQKHYMEFMTN